MKVRRISSPSSLVVSLEDAKTYLRVLHNEEDSYIEDLIVAGAEEIEDVTNICLVEASYLELRDSFSERIGLYKNNAKSITSILYLDSEGTYQTLNPSLYELVNGGNEFYVRFLVDNVTFPTIVDDVDCLKITYVAGEAVPANINKKLALACYIYVGHFYENRQAVNGPHAFYEFLSSMRLRNAI